MVSIHAPTRGATPLKKKKMIFTKVSIHAPTRGATFSEHALPATAEVSIHAPTRGATIWSRALTVWVYGFNPRTHTGCDASIKGRGTHDLMFQSTHPHGVRRDLWRQCGPVCEVSIHAPTRGATTRTLRTTASTRCFNPRTHTGCDL